MSPRLTRARRPLGLGALALSLGAAAIGLAPGPAAAFSSSKCNDAVQTDTSFCVLDGATFDDASAKATTLAAEPVGLDLQWNNISTGLSADKTRWLSSIGFTDGNGTVPGPIITAGSALPDKLLVGGFPSNADNCAPGSDGSFSSCTAGTGTALIEVTDGLGNVSVKQANVGVHSIVSVTPTDPSVLADYQVVLEINSPGTLSSIDLTATEDLIVNADTGSGITATMAAQGTATDSLSGTTKYDWSLSSLRLLFTPTSEMLADGSAASQTYTVSQLADTCIPQFFAVSATDRANSEVTVSKDLATTGCPSTPTGFSGSGSLPFLAYFSAGESVAGDRPLAAKPYLWDFGDGSTAQTQAASTSHTYSDASGHDVTLTAVDAAGAKSQTVSIHLSGSKITLGPTVLNAVYGRGTKVTGTLKDYEGGTALAGRSVAVYTCTPGAVRQQLAGTGTVGSTGAFNFKIQAYSPGLYCAQFNGENGRLGVESTPIQVKVHYRVTFKTSTTSVARGGYVRLFGQVSPNASGERVLVQRRVGGRWRTFSRPTISSRGEYSVRTAFTWRSRTAVLRVIKPGSDGYLRGHSSPRKVTITQS